MTSKVKESGRKSLSSWMTCEICQSILSQKDLTIHHTNCPPNFETWNHDFIYNNVLYSTVETYNSLGIYICIDFIFIIIYYYCIFFYINVFCIEQPKNIHVRALDDMVFISQSALQLCEIAIGDSVLVTVGENKVVKTAWPTKDKSLTSVSITKHGNNKIFFIEHIISNSFLLLFISYSNRIK